MTFDEARARFPVLERSAYLNAGTFGPLSRATIAALAETERWEGEYGRGGRAYFDRTHELRARVRDRIAGQIGAAAENVALTDSTTASVNIVLGGLRLGPDDEVVTTDAEHLGLIGPLATTGARLRIATVRDRPAADAFDAIRAEITPRTRLLALSHVAWTTGHVLPVDGLRDVGIPLLVDGAQSVGAIPVDVTPFDFYTVSAQKWLCGPASTGALYVREPESLRVTAPSYFSAAVYDLAAGTFEPKEDASRFDPGWIPAAALAGLDAALDDLPEWRFERAAETAARCRALLAERYEVVTEPGQATLVSFRPDGDPALLAASAYEQGVVLRDLPGTGLLRVSCGWWTSEADLERLLAALEP